MPLNITTGSLSAKGFGFTNLGIVRLTTGAEQTASVTASTAIQLANGNIVTGANISSAFPAAQSLRYKALTVINSTAVYGLQQTVSYNNCGGGSFNATSLSSGNIVSGVQISEDGENRYTGIGNLYYKSFDLTYKNTLSWSGASTTSVVQTGQWTDVPSTSVTNSATVNICTGQAYFVASGNCGRLNFANIDHFLYYRTLTVS
jgi:hypothetical protein